MVLDRTHRAATERRGTNGQRVPKAVDPKVLKESLTFSVEEYASLVGIGLASAYAAVERGEVEVIRHGRTRRVVAAPVRERLRIQS